MMHYYYSVYSYEYLHKGLVLYESMKKYDKAFHFFVICMDEKAEEILRKIDLKDLTIVPIKELYKYDPELERIRSLQEDKSYGWLVKAASPFYFFEMYPEIDHLLWLDGDTAFLSDPQPIYDEWADYSILLSEEKFEGEHKHLGELYGVYNCGFIGFKRDEKAFECLKYYREKLIESNYDDYVGSWNDQLYVSDWPVRFRNVWVIKNPGINITPFINYYKYYKERGWKASIREDGVYLGDNKIILYHYMALKYFNGNEFDLCNYVMDFEDNTINHIYIPYLNASILAYEKINSLGNDLNIDKSVEHRHIRNYYNLERNSRFVKYTICTITAGEYLSHTIGLYQSLLKNCEDFHLWICCMDDYSYSYLKDASLENITLIHVRNLEADDDKELKSAKESRNMNEYMYTIKPYFVFYILKNNYNINNILFVASGLCFMHNPRRLFQLLSNHSVMIFANPLSRKTALLYGKYRSDVIWFRRDGNTFECLKWWIERCRELCNERFEGDKGLDLKYISLCKDTFEGIGIVRDNWYEKIIDYNQ